MTNHNTSLFNFFIIISVFLRSTLTQPQKSQDSPPSHACNGVFLSYAYTGGHPIPPTVDPANQPYRFESTATLLNNDLDELKSWKLLLGFQHNEVLVSASDSVLADGASLPAQVGNGVVLAGSAVKDLKSAVETAGDVNQTGVVIRLVGTQFGVGPPSVPMPVNISLVNDDYSCPSPTTQGSNGMHLCCTRDLSTKNNTTLEEEIQPRQKGDLLIMYDIISSYETYYWAQVNISNHNPLSRVDNWKLSWEWTRDEFVYAMKGAYPTVIDTRDRIFGRQGQYYRDMDFSTALSCEKRPTIIDLPPTRANDSKLGIVPFCCRNGTILPPSVDSTKSISSFRMQVYKMPPDLNRAQLTPPQNWKINGTGCSDYECGPPMRVIPTRFPDPTGLPSETTAIASWQVVCEIKQSKKASPRCCVSFSAFFNDSAVPCGTCACGCNQNPTKTCSPTEPPLFLRPDTLLLPSENRTKKALEWAKIKDWPVPDLLPCGDNCGVNINWHLDSDYRGGWTARMTLLNWAETESVDWFVAVELDEAGPGFERAFSFNASLLPGSNDSIVFMKGFQGLNYLLGAKNGANPRKDFKAAGMQQSVILLLDKNG
ncbi:COBRA-like protein [Parasponia andersonii]|uniref:COBRA-like protein n=1 Tax=Parasponia andersonii TaxID=3476 RepID=A0A2P5AVI1_PARAD|nr:COBRA-like protein [Parasponia andersonii]